jgi:hypothetical protein
MNKWCPPPLLSKKQRKSSNRNKRSDRALMNLRHLYSNMMVILSEISRSIRIARCSQMADATLVGAIHKSK